MKGIDKYEIYEDGYFKSNLSLLKEYCESNQLTFEYGGDHSNTPRLWVNIGNTMFISYKDRDDSTSDIIEFINEGNELKSCVYNLDYMKTIDDEYKYTEARKSHRFFANKK